MRFSRLIKPSFGIISKRMSSSYTDKYLLIDGLRKFSNREDITSALGKHTFTSAYQVLGGSLLPTGSWVVEFKYADELHSCRAFLRNSSLCTSRFITHNEFTKLTTTASARISNRTVLFGASPDIGFKEVIYFFSSYHLASSDPIRLTSHGSNRYFFVEFETPEEAERAVIEKISSNIGGEKPLLHWYDF